MHINRPGIECLDSSKTFCHYNSSCLSWTQLGAVAAFKAKSARRSGLLWSNATALIAERCRSHFVPSVPSFQTWLCAKPRKAKQTVVIFCWMNYLVISHLFFVICISASDTEFIAEGHRGESISQPQRIKVFFFFFLSLDCGTTCWIERRKLTDRTRCFFTVTLNSSFVSARLLEWCLKESRQCFVWLIVPAEWFLSSKQRLCVSPSSVYWCHF